MEEKDRRFGRRDDSRHEPTSLERHKVSSRVRNYTVERGEERERYKGKVGNHALKRSEKE